MRGCVVGMAEGCFEMEPGSCRAFAWPLILLNSSSTITHTHCLKQGCRMETMGSSPGLTDLCPMLFIPRLPFQTLLPEPSQSLLDEEDEEDPARGTTDRDLFHSDQHTPEHPDMSELLPEARSHSSCGEEPGTNHVCSWDVGTQRARGQWESLPLSPEAPRGLQQHRIPKARQGRQGRFHAS